MSAKQHEARNEKCEDVGAYLKFSQLLLTYIANRLSPTSCIKPDLWVMLGCILAGLWETQNILNSETQRAKELV